MAEGIGDVNSQAKGSGARYNTGKPPMQYIPIEQQFSVLENHEDPANHVHGKCMLMMSFLAEFEKGVDEAVEQAIQNLTMSDLQEAAYVWEYGAKKYAAWNWAKGMPWTVPLACISRHATSIIARNELIDPESKCTHWGHIVCNLLMLDHYTRYYRAGDDRPPSSIFERESGDE